MANDFFRLPSFDLSFLKSKAPEGTLEDIKGKVTQTVEQKHQAEAAAQTQRAEAEKHGEVATRDGVKAQSMDASQQAAAQEAAERVEKLRAAKVALLGGADSTSAQADFAAATTNSKGVFDVKDVEAETQELKAAMAKVEGQATAYAKQAMGFGELEEMFVKHGQQESAEAEKLTAAAGQSDAQANAAEVERQKLVEQAKEQAKKDQAKIEEARAALVQQKMLEIDRANKAAESGSNAVGAEADAIANIK